MIFLLVLVVQLLLLAGCARQPSPTPAPATPSPPAIAAVLSATPSPSPAFVPGPVILPTVAIPSPTQTPTRTAEESLAVTLDTIGSRTSVLRGLFALEPVHRELITRRDLIARLREDFEEEREDIHDTQMLYTTLGILDRNADLYELLLRIYGEDVLGYFDTELKKLFVVKDAPEFGLNDALTAAHESVHALQQQYFDIHSTSKRLEGLTDRLRAFKALVEGDATVSQTFYMFQHMSEAERLEVLESASSAETRAFASAPHVIQRTITFPYAEGPQFVFDLYVDAQGWDSVNLAFTDPPQTTEQVLHPEKYTMREAPAAVNLPDMVGALGDGWTLVRRDTLGEFLLLAYLETGVSPEEASTAAGGWGGDSYALLRGPQGQTLVVSRVNWDSEADATEFFQIFLDFMRRYKGGAWEAVGEERLGQIMRLPDQSIYIKRDKADTVLIFAPDIAVLERARVAVEGS